MVKNMKALSFYFLMVFNYTRASNVFHFLHAFDKSALDWIHYTTIQFTTDTEQDLLENYYHDTLITFEDSEPDQYFHTLVVTSWNTSNEVLENRDCKETKAKFIKDPYTSYLIYDEYFSGQLDTFTSFPCMFQFQPYFFIISKIEGSFHLHEIQVYSKSIFLIGTAKNSNVSDIEYFNTNVLVF